MNSFDRLRRLDFILYPLFGIGICLMLWQMVAGKSTVTQTKDDWGDTVTVTKRHGLSADLPTPTETWEASRKYVLEPFAKRGELDQGILRFTWLSLVLVAQGYALAVAIGVPVGFCLGLSKTFAKMFDPIFQVLRPVSPLAWLPLGMARRKDRHETFVQFTSRHSVKELQELFSE